MSNVYQGSPSEDERIAAESQLFRAVLRGLAYDLRVAMPGKITSFDENAQTCSVQLAIRDKLKVNNRWSDVKIPELPDVPLVLPGDTNWCVTFPNLVGCEVLVIFADMCINAWWSTGVVPSNQETDRRHDYSDGFAILAPRSRPNAIQNYSTTEMQLRSMDGNTAISLDASRVTTKAAHVKLDGALELTGTPTATTGSPTFSLPITIGTDTYYLQLKKTP